MLYLSKTKGKYLIFLVLATPLFGFICDAKFSPWLVSGIGTLLMFVCFVFIGPCPYMSFIPATFASVCGSLVAQGFGCSAVLVASFSSAQIAAVAAGFPDSMEVQAVVSGLFTSAFALGNFCGPTVSGVLYDIVGFEYNLLVLQALVIIIFIMNMIVYCVPPLEVEHEVEIDTPSPSKEDLERKPSDAYPELAADIIRSRAAPPRPTSTRKYSTSSSVYERGQHLVF